MKIGCHYLSTWFYDYLLWMVHLNPVSWAFCDFRRVILSFYDVTVSVDSVSYNAAFNMVILLCFACWLLSICSKGIIKLLSANLSIVTFLNKCYLPETVGLCWNSTAVLWFHICEEPLSKQLWALLWHCSVYDVLRILTFLALIWIMLSWFYLIILSNWPMPKLRVDYMVYEWLSENQCGEMWFGDLHCVVIVLESSRSLYVSLKENWVNKEARLSRAYLLAGNHCISWI